MIEAGTIKEVENNRVTVQMAPRTPEQCASCGCCGDHRGNQHLLILSKNQDETLHDAAPGDKVELELNLPNQAVAAALLFGLPLLMIFIGAGAAWHLNPESEGQVILGGGAGLITGGVLVWLANRLLWKSGHGIRVIKLHKE